MPPDQHLYEFFSSLQQYRAPQVFNPWAQRNADDQAAHNGPQQRLQRLQAHLASDVRQLLLGEASGYQGCRISGVPFTSERLLLAGAIPRLPCPRARLSTRERPWSEPSATTVWSVLQQHGIADSTLLWNAFAWHPFKDGERLSNRTPGPRERAHGLEVLELLLAAIPHARLFAVGRHAQQLLEQLGRASTALRHPSMGGALRFRLELGQALARQDTAPRRRRRATRRAKAVARN